MRSKRRVILPALAGAIALAGVCGVASAADVGPDYGVDPAGGMNEPAFGVEDYTHPGSGWIALRDNIYLGKGDGHIIYTPCSGDKSLIQVDTSASQRLCFRLDGTTGRLEMRIPQAFSVKAAAGVALSVTTYDFAASDRKTFPVEPSRYAHIGAGGRTALIEIATR